MDEKSKSHESRLVACCGMSGEMKSEEQRAKSKDVVLLNICCSRADLCDAMLTSGLLGLLYRVHAKVCNSDYREVRVSTIRRRVEHGENG